MQFQERVIDAVVGRSTNSAPNEMIKDSFGVCLCLLLESTRETKENLVDEREHAQSLTTQLVVRISLM